MSDIELVIKIPEEDYNFVKRQVVDGITNPLKICIANGTPLPKGHGRLKDENEVKQMIEDAKVENEYSKNFAENIIRFAPTILEADTESEDKE